MFWLPDVDYFEAVDASAAPFVLIFSTSKQ